MVPPQICLVCLIGLPASGKTTLAKHIEARYKSNFIVDVVSYDDEICWDDGSSWKEKRSFVRDAVVSRIKHFFCSQKQSILVLDDNMFYRSMRYEYYQLARRFQTGFCQIYIPTPLHICLELNRRRIIPVPENTILKINHLLEIPDPSKHFWEKNSLLLTSPLNVNDKWIEEDWEKVELLIQHCLLDPIKQVSKPTSESNSVGTLHLVDIALRKLVNTLIMERKDKYNNSETYGKELMIRRKRVLDKVRSGELKLPKPNDEENYILFYSEFLVSHLMEMKII